MSTALYIEFHASSAMLCLTCRGEPTPHSSQGGGAAWNKEPGKGRVL